MFFNFIFDLFLIFYYFCSWDYITEHYIKKLFKKDRIFTLLHIYNFERNLNWETMCVTILL